MENPFIYSTTNKRYHTFDYYLKNKYGCKVFKVALDGGFSCPNRDGLVGYGGCIFCSNQGSGEFAGNVIDDLYTQFNKQKAIMHKKWPVAKYIAYFQNYSNTYASVDYLKSKFEPFVNYDNVVAIAIATRADCLPKDVLDYLEDLNKRMPIVIELGLQTIHDKTALLINRGYPYKVFELAVNELAKRNIPIVVHIINGLPNEDEKMMIETAKRLATLPLHGVKIHSLCLLKNTKLEEMYNENPFHILEKDEYIEIMMKQIEVFPKNFVIERITGDAKKEDLIAPLWSLKKTVVANDLDKIMLKYDTYQGKKYISSSVYYSHKEIESIENKKVAVDATCGNGHDSLFLKDLFQKVYAIDIQPLAIKRCSKKFIGINNIELILDNFVNIDNIVKEKVDCVIYNLGFLPGSDHKIKTNHIDTLISINKAYNLLNENGKIIVVSYTKHDFNEEYNYLKDNLEKLYKLEIIKAKDERILIIKK